ncbi:hypothetical protein [Achromobacter xylosoxidans]|uniref:hypothetical protein n=1 Tax=Alcaligenes xylosoxydans xylosoxydans TaxID=85698 RepID=UPI0015C58826|nr:hypothetical protein [Achromobacter xylosoxidans]
MQLVDRAGIELEVARHGGGIGARLLDGFAGIGRLQLRQLFLAVQQREGDAHQEAAARGGRHLAPLAVISLARSGHGAVYVLGGRTRDCLERRAIGRVQDGNGCAGGGFHPLVGDKVLLSHDVRSKVAAGRPVAGWFRLPARTGGHRQRAARGVARELRFGFGSRYGSGPQLVN